MCFLLTLVGFGLLCFLPFCIEDCKDVKHSCPRCGNDLGTGEYRIC